MPTARWLLRRRWAADPVLRPTGPARASFGDRVDLLNNASGNPLVHRLDPADGHRLLGLGCHLVWATTWMAEAVGVRRIGRDGVCPSGPPQDHARASAVASRRSHCSDVPAMPGYSSRRLPQSMPQDST